MSTLPPEDDLLAPQEDLLAPEGELPAGTSPVTKAVRDLARAETKLVRWALREPAALSPRDLARLRYLLSFARLTAFEPGIAGVAGARPGTREDVDVTDVLAPFRERVAREVTTVVRAPGGPADRLEAAAALSASLRPALKTERDKLGGHLAGRCTPEELDAEVGHRVMVNAAGGGGGAGYVYLGAYERLDEAGIAPALVIGSSIGALLGVFRARDHAPDWPELLSVAKHLDRRSLFAPISRRRRFGMPGLLVLNLRQSLEHLFLDEGGTPLTLADLEVPYEAVVAGVRRRPFELLPQQFQATETVGGEGELTEPRSRVSPARLAPTVAMRMWQATAFFDARLVEPVVLGADDATRSIRALDAAGFSAAIPGVLHYDLPSDDDGPGARALQALLAERELAALVDGGVVANVPTELAWRRVQAGRLGTRNAMVLAFDCFHPQWDPRHLWLQPVTQAIMVQMRRGVLFADSLVRFSPTLSPVSLVPSAEALDQCRTWGRESIEKALPLVQALLTPVRWA